MNPKIAPGTGGAGSPGGPGVPSGNEIPTEQAWEAEAEKWKDYQFDHSEWKNKEREKKEQKKQKEQDTCSISEQPIQEKAGFDELPDSQTGKYYYSLETGVAKDEMSTVWKNPEAKKELLNKLAKIETGELTARNQKFLQGYKNLKEYKFNKIRIIVNPGKNGGPDQILGIVVRSRLEHILETFKGKYN